MVVCGFWVVGWFSSGGEGGSGLVLKVVSGEIRKTEKFCIEILF